MNKEQIDALVAGPDLDALVSQLMGAPKELADLVKTEKFVSAGWTLYPYSTDMVSAWKVVEKLKLTVWPTEEGRWFVFKNPFRESYGDEYWFGGDEFQTNVKNNFNADAWTISDTAPLAICRCALKLKAVGK